VVWGRSQLLHYIPSKTTAGYPRFYISLSFLRCRVQLIRAGSRAVPSCNCLP
jgi:hypothetical protein